MTNLDDASAWIADRLPSLLAECDVPAAAVAVYAEGRVIEHASGLLNLRTGVEADTDSVFQIGSITKVWTATLVMQLVDEGRIDLDAPVRHYLPEFAVADTSASDVITVRQLLTHTAGFEGDIFTDTGNGDDNLQKYLVGLHDVPQLFPPGEQFSYNNAGYCVLGRLVEVLRGMPFDQCLRDQLLTPLSLTYAATSASEAILFRAAVGHIKPEPEAAQVPAPVWSMARSNAPAGSILSMRVADLLTFARMHLNSGAAPDGTAVLAPGATKAMQQRQVELPDLRYLGNAWGLGWEIYDSPAGTVIGHDGNTVGQASFLRMVPERDVAIALLTNGGDPMSLYRALVGHLLPVLTGVDLPAAPVPPASPPRIDATRYVGTYSLQVADLVVSQDDDGRIWLETTPKGELAEMGQHPERTQLVPFADDTLIPLEPQQGMHMPHAFLGDDGTGRASYLHIGRAVPRTAAADA